MFDNKSGRTVLLFGATLLLLFLLLLFNKPSQAAPEVTINVITSTWELDDEPNKVNVAAEIENNSGQYLKDVTVEATLKNASGNMIAVGWAAALKEYLAPGEKTFFKATLTHASASQTKSVEFVAFGESSSAQEYPYLADPQPSYVESEVVNGGIWYYGEIENRSGKTWQADCYLCDALDLVGAYYDNGKLVGYSTSFTKPNGHIKPGEKLAFRFYFKRLPDGEFKLFGRAKPLQQGKYATSWAVEDLKWELVDGSSGKEVDVSATIRNQSDVAAEPSIWFIARNTSGKWIGATYCSFYSDLEPAEAVDCDATIASDNIHAGDPEDIHEVEALVASEATTDQPPPLDTAYYLPIILAAGGSTPEPTPTPTNTPVPTAVPDPVRILPNHFAHMNSSGTLLIVGEVQNDTTDHLRFVDLTANIYDGQGNLLDTDSSFTRARTIAPGAKACFQMRFRDAPASWDHYSFGDLSYRDSEPFPPLVILNDDGSYSDWGDYKITGQIRNDSSKKMGLVNAVATLYDASNTVLACDNGYVDSGDLSLAPGQTASFEIFSTDRDYADVASYTLQASGSSSVPLLAGQQAD